MRIYSKVEGPQDIKRINCLIRDEMLVVKSEAELTELKKRSDYLCVLTYSPFWKKKFKEIDLIQTTALQENRVTTKEANIIAKYKGFNKEYHPFKSEIDIENELRKIPDSIIKEITTTAISFEKSIEILESLRSEFCEIRKGMVLCEDNSCLLKLKKAVDILSLLPYTLLFKEHFDEGVLGAIEYLINQEKTKSVDLANIISEVNGWDEYFEAVSEEDFNEDIESVIQKLIKEEEKSSTIIPTQSRYKDGGKVLWLVYYHPKRKREYAKRVYLPAKFKNLKIEGPSYFKNRFKNRVYGVKISYEMSIDPTTITIRGKEIKLPQRWIKKEKIVPLPQIAQNVRLLEKRPDSAMDIA